MRVGQLIRRWRRASDKGVREVAAEIGVSHGTLSRIERDEDMTGDTLAKVLAWLMSNEASKNGKARTE